MSQIEVFFCPPEGDYEPERDYIRELKTYLFNQPQDAWLLFALTMNWDVTDSIAEEMVTNLTRDYNKARQALITKELAEIIGGSEALN